MLIHWFTVLAEIVNFLVLVALLKHFLWGKLVRAIDQREARIAGELARAEEQRRTAQEQMDQIHAVTLEQQRKCDEMISQARKEADEVRNQMIQKSRDSVRAMQAQWQQELERDRATFFKELRKRAASEILAIARQALGDLASRDLQCSAVRVFLEKLRSFDGATLRQMEEGELAVRSAVELPESIQQEITSLLAERMGPSSHPRFTVEPAMGWGIELRGNGLRIGWDPGTYTDLLEEKLRGELDRYSAAAYRAAAD